MKKRSGGQDQGPGRMIGVKLFLEFHAQRVDDTIRVSVVASHLHDGQHILVRKAACSERGRVVVVDVAVPDTKLSEDFNTAERLRDPSHVRALSAREQRDLLTDSGLTIRSAAEYRVEYELEHLLEFSSASERDKHRIRQLLAADESPFFERREERSFVRYPIVLYVASRGVL